MRRSGPLKRSGGLKRKPPNPRWPYDGQLAHEWFLAVTRPHGKKAPCAACGNKRVCEGHHVIAKQTIKDYALGKRLTNAECQALLWSSDNGIPVCRRCHEAHENGSKRIPRDKLPMRCFLFAEKLGLRHRLEPPVYP